MKNIIEITAALADLPPGSKIRVVGYVPSKKSPRDYELELLPRDGYRRIQRESMEILRNPKTDLSRLAPMGPVAAPDVAVLVGSIQKSLLAADNPAPKGGPAYEQVKNGSLYTLPSAPGAVYLQRLLRLSDPPKEDMTKPLTGAPAIMHLLDLPLGRYIHVLQLADGKFDSVEVL